jgi:chemotaxis protein histidine kinase CheA
MTNSLMARFIPEARELLEATASGLLRLEKTPNDADAVNEVFRAVHTLKGTSGLFDIPALTRLIHVAEDLLGAVRAEELAIDGAIIDDLLAALDQVALWVSDMELNEALPPDSEGVSSTLAKRLRAHQPDAAHPLAANGPAASASSDVNDWLALFGPEILDGLQAELARGVTMTVLHYAPAHECYFNGSDPLNNVLSMPGLWSARARPSAVRAKVGDYNPYHCDLEFVALSSAPREEIEHHFRYEIDQVALAECRGEGVEPQGGAQQALAQESAPPAAPRPATQEIGQRKEIGERKEPGERRAQKFLRVDQAKIDLLMNLIGELVVSKNSLPFLATKAEKVHGSREMAREIKDQYAVIDRLAQEMQGAIMAVRMLPVGEVFDRFPRLVRDIARKLGKDVQLVVEGGDTAADKTIIEALGDPLLHILRNALDHGIETPDQRQAADKPTLATLSMRAYQEADRVVIEVADDGRGIDPARIRAAAVAKGLIDPAKAAALSDDEAMNLVFLPGSSTAAEVSDLSGRGVGMDAVRNAVEKLGGRVNLQSTLGRGTRIALTLPLSMAVTRVMIIEAAGGLYGVPMDLIVETVRIPRERIHAIKQSEAFVLRDRLVPLVRLAGLLREQERPREPDEPEAVLVCRIAERLVGLVIDQFRTGLDAVIKPLDGLIARTRGVSGTTLLGDGRVLLVLDLKELL